MLSGALTGAVAQEAARAPFLVVDQERILTGSARGADLLAAEEAARDALRATAREIETAFEAEERDLTARRADLSPEDFRRLADDFDGRVVAARAEQDARASALAQDFDQRRRQFYSAVAPILVQVMESLGAQAIFDENSVLLVDQALNITDEVIAAIDRTEDPDAAAVPSPETPGPEAAPAAGSD